jgi:hypothetical protein
MNIKDYLEEIKINKLIKKYPKWSYENWNNDIEFIWGIKSWDDTTGQPVCMYTMNDLELVYNHITKLYSLDIETIYQFDSFKDEVEYLEGLLDKFTEFMNKSNLKTNYITYSKYEIVRIAETIEELYTNFKMFVNGRKSVLRSDDYGI